MLVVDHHQAQAGSRGEQRGPPSGPEPMPARQPQPPLRPGPGGDGRVEPGQVRPGTGEGVQNRGAVADLGHRDERGAARAPGRGNELADERPPVIPRPRLQAPPAGAPRGEIGDQVVAPAVGQDSAGPRPPAQGHGRPGLHANPRRDGPPESQTPGSAIALGHPGEEAVVGRGAERGADHERADGGEGPGRGPPLQPDHDPPDPASPEGDSHQRADRDLEAGRGEVVEGPIQPPRRDQRDYGGDELEGRRVRRRGAEGHPPGRCAPT
jgi:hypothetical protein